MRAIIFITETCSFNDLLLFYDDLYKYSMRITLTYIYKTLFVNFIFLFLLKISFHSNDLVVPKVCLEINCRFPVVRFNPDSSSVRSSGSCFLLLIGTRLLRNANLLFFKSRDSTRSVASAIRRLVKDFSKSPDDKRDIHEGSLCPRNEPQREIRTIAKVTSKDIDDIIQESFLARALKFLLILQAKTCLSYSGFYNFLE